MLTARLDRFLALFPNRSEYERYLSQRPDLSDTERLFMESRLPERLQIGGHGVKPELAPDALFAWLVIGWLVLAVLLIGGIGWIVASFQ